MDVETIERHSFPCERINLRRSDLASVVTHVTEAKVIRHDHYNVGGRGRFFFGGAAPDSHNC